jgi:repressor LexA
MAIKLTARQQQVFDLIRSEITRTGFPPTRMEIARALGFKSANAAEDHLKALARKGVIDLTAGASRGIRINPGAANGGGEPYPYSTNTAANDATASLASSALTLLLPIIGRVAAGSPVLATEHIEREIGVEPALFSQTPDYLLKVQGTSMRDAGILDGDLLAVKKTAEARNGQIVVARLGDDVTVKRLSRSGRSITLLPENPDFSPIRITAADNFSLEGIAVGLIRTTALN